MSDVTGVVGGYETSHRLPAVDRVRSSAVSHVTYVVTSPGPDRSYVASHKSSVWLWLRLPRNQQPTIEKAQLNWNNQFLSPVLIL